MKPAKAPLLALLLCWAFAVVALADVAVPPLTGRVVDQTNTLSSGDIASLTQTLTDFENKKGSQVAVLIVPTTAPEAIEPFSIRVAEAWKIGRKKIDDGVILVVAKDDHKLRIEVGYGLEGVLTDITSKRIIDEAITPKFKNGDFAGGISDGVSRILGVIDGEPLPAPAPQSEESGSFAYQLINPFNPFVIIGVMVLGVFLRGIFGRLIGSLATGGLIGVLAWFIVGSLVVSLVAAAIASVFTLLSDSLASGNGGRGGGFIGSGGSFSGGGSSGGGFSGGGGSFGGGGASGSW